MLEKILLMLTAVQNSVDFLHSPSPEIIRALSENDELKELKFLVKCRAEMENGADFRSAWKRSVCSDRRYLKVEDRDLLISFGSFFGTSDAEGQIANCRLHSELASVRTEQAKAARDRYASLACSLGLICGIGTVIILI